VLKEKSLTCLPQAGKNFFKNKSEERLTKNRKKKEKEQISFLNEV
jgi:hypothetical protein